MVDKDEYPQTAEIERRCVNMVADLFNAPSSVGDGTGEDRHATGVSTIGSSEAVMLAGLAMKWRWRERRRAEGAAVDRPNLVLGSNVQVVWEKFCRYWDVEPRSVPMAPGRYVVTSEGVTGRIDENTIGVVAILGTTFTGELEPIVDIHDALERHTREHDIEVPLHVDAASGGFVVPFLDPDLEWDFRLPLVRSINVSGHKYGLTYPGIGFAVWRSKEDLPDDLVFHVDYLGGDMPTFTLNFSRPGNQLIGQYYNFSRPGNQLIGQYYNFVRLGRSGYERIMKSLQAVACGLSARLEESGRFEVIHDGSDLPVLAFRLRRPVAYTEYDVSDQLRRHGWQVPAYTLPPDAQDITVLRVVVREGFDVDLAELLLQHLEQACVRLDRDGGSAPPDTGFTHT